MGHVATSVQRGGGLLLSYPYDKGHLVIFVSARNLPASNCGEVDPRHQELIVCCPTTSTGSIRLERLGEGVNSPTADYQFRLRFRMCVISLSPEKQLLPERWIAGGVVSQPDPRPGFWEAGP